ncbi:MAG: YkgJ family cysteine cluster protein [Nevskiales bacterium]
MVTSLFPPAEGWRHPCLNCGACCAHYRASFYWAEADDATPGGVPVALTAPLTPYLRVMRGTDQPQPRCIALMGEIGRDVYCNIHPQRASVCRDYPPSYEDGKPNPRCDEARAVHGLPPLTLQDWQTQPHEPDDDQPRPTSPQPSRLPQAA